MDAGSSKTAETVMAAAVAPIIKTAMTAFPILSELKNVDKNKEIEIKVFVIHEAWSRNMHTLYLIQIIK